MLVSSGLMTMLQCMYRVPSSIVSGRMHTVMLCRLYTVMSLPYFSVRQGKPSRSSYNKLVQLYELAVLSCTFYLGICNPCVDTEADGVWYGRHTLDHIDCTTCADGQELNLAHMACAMCAHGVCDVCTRRVHGGDGGDARCVRLVLVWPVAERR